MSAAEAEAGVEGGEFDFSVTFPADFTASLESSQGESPHQASVVLRTNDANSYLASTIGDQATKRIQAQIVQQVNREAAQHMLDGVAEIRVSLVKASDGAAQASSGATTLHQGLGQLRDGTAALPEPGKDSSCGHWTRGEGGSAIVGHHDRTGTNPDPVANRSWNASHGTRGCSLPQLAQSGSAGLLYCFAVD